MKKLFFYAVIISAVLVFTAGYGFAQEADLAEEDFSDPFAGEEDSEPDSLEGFDSMFEDDEMIEEIDEKEASKTGDASDDFLLSDGVELGGSFSGRLSSSFNYDYMWTKDFDITDPSQSFVPSVNADLFFDARPESHYRAFGKLGFESEVKDKVELNIKVKELFADFDWKNRLYFRFGKSMIKWGVGYFWSPSDVLNLASINVEDPLAEREGPVSFKMHLPFDINNAYLYLITDNVTEPLDTAIASKVEFVIGGTEIGIGAFYQRDLVPRAVATVSTSIGDFSIFGEGVASWGSDRVFVRAASNQMLADANPDDTLEIVLDTYEINDRPFFSATIGTRYMHEFDNNAGTIMFVGEYFFNGEGYSYEEGLLSSAYWRLVVDNQPQALTDLGIPLPPTDGQPKLGAEDLINFGQHYLGGIISWSSIFDTDLSFSTLVIANMNDFSGMVIPSFSYKIIDYISVAARARFTFGDAGDEYTNPAALLSLGLLDEWDGPVMGLTLDCTIGGGSF